MEKDDSLVSICMPAYNAEKFILDAVESILQQTYSNIELIVVNDGSTDNTEKILNSINDARLKVLSLSSNRGQCSAANLAFNTSKGQLVKFIDADDLISVECIEKQVAILNGDFTKVASSEWGRFYNNDLSTFNLNPESVWRNMEPIDWLVESLSSSHNMMQCGLWLIPRVILKKSGLWNEKLSLINDFDFIIRVILSSEKILFTKDAILYYRSGLKDSLSKQTSYESMKSALLSVEAGIETMLSYENSSRVKKVGADTMQLWMYNFFPNYLDLYIKAKRRIFELGGSDFDFPSGGKTRILASLIGWKITKRIKFILKNFQLVKSIYI